jgi:sulfate adenylyltransferase large subunit
MAPFDEGTPAGLLRFTTAGSVDDGKSSLIGRLLYDANAVPSDQLAALERHAARAGETDIDLSLLTDGLSAEREQGITIDVAYRYFATPRRKFIIADTPGHEQYTRNMVTGASTADAAVILVDVQKGMTIQTRRHIYLSHLLGIPHLVIAINKMDLAGFERQAFDAVARQVAEFAVDLETPRPHFVPLSAKFGDNVVRTSPRTPWYPGPTLLALLEGLPAGLRTEDQFFRFPVQLVRRVPGPEGGAKGAHVRQYLGRIESGRIAVGDKIVVQPSGALTSVRGISTFDGPLESAVARQSVALEVADDVDIARGDLLAHRNSAAHVAGRIQATICWFADQALEGHGLRGDPGNKAYVVKCGTRTVAARFAEIVHRMDVNTLLTEPHPATLARNDIARVHLALASPAAFDSYHDNRVAGAFIVIDAESNATVAAGMVEA